MLYKILFLVTAFHAVAAVPVLQPDESVATLDDKSFAAPETRAVKLSKLKKLVQELSVGKKDVKAEVDWPDFCPFWCWKGLRNECRTGLGCP